MNNFPDRLPIAVVGLSFGSHILKVLHEQPAASFFEPVLVCDARKELADREADRYGIRACYALDDVLKDPTVRVVGLYTRPHERAALLKETIQAGKDVITTKPFELDMEKAAEVIRLAIDSGRTIHLNSPSPEPTEDIRQIESWRRSYDLGRLVSARGEVWASYQEEADGSWMDDPEVCPGGPMTRLGIYLINDIIRLAGPVKSVHLTSSRVRTGRPTPDNAFVTLTCDSGCLASVYASFCVEDGGMYSNGLTLNFERGTIYRNVGCYPALAQNGQAHLSLVTQIDGQRKVMAETRSNECSGMYQWDMLHRAITRREGMDVEYAERILAGVHVLDALRSHHALAPAEEYLSPV